MSTAEALEIYADVIERWPHSAVVRDRLIADLAAAQFDHARAAVETLYRDGREFAPNGAQIIGRIADMALDAPDWGTVKAEIDRRRAGVGGARWAHDNRSCPDGLCDGRGWLPEPDTVDLDTRHQLVAVPCPCRDQLRTEIAEATGIHPLVNQFIFEVGRAEIAALDGDRVAEAQVRKKYDEFVANARRSTVYFGIDPAGLPALERLQHERAARAGLLPAGHAPKALRRSTVIASITEEQDS